MAGRWVASTTMTKEMRERSEDKGQSHVTEQAIDLCKRQGYHPVGDPRIDWYEISEWEAAMSRGMYDGLELFRAGDWRARVVLMVQEDQEIPQ